MHVTAIVVAGGRGERFGGATPKQLLDLDGRTVLERCVEAFASHPRITEVLVVLPAPLVEWGAAALAVFRARVVPGGARRQDSVACGFDAASADAGVLLVHDAVRPLVPAAVIDRVIDAAWAHGAAIAALRARDTVKKARVVGGQAFVDATIPRDEIWLAQTPQGFRRDVLTEAIEIGRGGVEATDEAMLAERAGHAVALVEGDVSSLKITTPGDLAVARALAGTPGAEQHRGAPRSGTKAARPRKDLEDGMRIGFGYDLHRFVEGRPLVLAGVTVPFEKGLLGHSDADAVCHAVTDALLSAANLGDIGKLFPDTDPQWKDADSLRLLEDAAARVRAAGYRVVNVDVVVVAERPKIGPHTAEMRARLSHALAVDPRDVGIKGKTNEGVDAIGRGEAIAVYAVALIAGGPWVEEYSDPAPTA
jgi:2-C-methyl-D-erythritol 4-phosphate cytidylyltransferase / 2-C-methyl-D-erythritol 2,4-cyclodiphosphate synthase